MSHEELQNKLNLCLRRRIVFTYNSKKYIANLNITHGYMNSLTDVNDTFIGVDDQPSDNEISNFYKIEEYLKAEGFFEI